MAREVPEIDRLIEQGLTLYGQGELDGALLAWEQVLSIDPENPQANSYVDYVRANYELLQTEVYADGPEGAPFGIADDEPEYQIEIQPGEIKASLAPTAPMYMDPLDEGWYIDDEPLKGPGGPDASLDRPSAQGLTVELVADEPPADEAPSPPILPPDSEVSFDDATREYQQARHSPERAADPFGSFAPSERPSNESAEFGPDTTPGFGHPNDFQTPPGFGTQTTDIKRRELGFVKPTDAASTGRASIESFDLELSGPPPGKPARSLSGSSPPYAPQRPPTADPAAASPLATERAFGDLDEADLIASLPSPRPAPKVPQIEIDTPLSGSQPIARSEATTRDFPATTRAPAFGKGPAVGATHTQDFDQKTMDRPVGSLDQTREIPLVASGVADPVISAPTRDLGLRDAPPIIRATTGRATPAAGVLAVGDGTRADVMLQFDPIDARSAEILEEVDQDAPATEQREDRTRRRITTLFDKAASWSAGGAELERAVAAIDLALSEDPGSALAQKLIHRNRETIMSVFQTYLGDLQRQPQLARPLHELASAPISPRAAFLLSRVDGLLSIDEILDVCGMPRLEAYRYLCQLFLRKILR